MVDACSISHIYLHLCTYNRCLPLNSLPVSCLLETGSIFNLFRRLMLLYGLIILILYTKVYLMCLWSIRKSQKTMREKRQSTMKFGEHSRKSVVQLRPRKILTHVFVQDLAIYLVSNNAVEIFHFSWLLLLQSFWCCFPKMFQGFASKILFLYMLFCRKLDWASKARLNSKQFQLWISLGLFSNYNVWSYHCMSALS